jgi:hypothetical protein
MNPKTIRGLFIIALIFTPMCFDWDLRQFTVTINTDGPQPISISSLATIFLLIVPAVFAILTGIYFSMKVFKRIA